MKKTGLLILLIALCLAAASVALAQTGPVARSGKLAVYSDGEGRLFLPGREDPINTKAAEDIVAIDAYRVLFTSAPEAEETAPEGSDAPRGSDLYMIDLESFEETLVAEGVYTACLSGEDTAWYVTQDVRDQLMRVSLKDFTAQTAYTAGEPIERLYVSLEGLILQMVDQAGAVLYVPETDRFEIYSGLLPRDNLMGDSYEICLTEGSDLYLKNDFNFTSALIDSDVTAFARMDGTIYYLTRTGSALRLMSCDPLTMSRKIVLIPAIDMENQLTASDHALFMLSSEGEVCKVDPKAGTITLFRKYDGYDAFDLPEDYTVSGLRIEAMSGQLNVYAELEEAAVKPDFSFIEFGTAPEAVEPKLRLIETHALYGEETAWDLLKPVPQYAPLARGSRGDAVRAIQQPLYDLGYYDYYVDGIFGPRTQYGVKMLQSDLGRPVTGIADAELQQIILSGKLSPFDPYLPLSRGRRGMRVQIMQERLRELGYLADAADGIFGPRTQKAVQLFQTENGVTFSEAATSETLRRLYSDTASRCSSYIDLFPGDTGYRVRELNNRLKALYYLEDSPGSAYTAQTSSAVRVFQRTAGLRETGEATQAVQRALFAENAPEAPGYIVLRRGDDNDRVEKLQRRLKQLNYYDGKITGYFGKSTKDAVALFQKQVGLSTSGIATVRTQQLLFDRDAPEYVPPTVIGEPVITVDMYDWMDRGVYYISGQNAFDGYVTFSWETEGDVKSYNVRITDEDGNVWLDEDTLMTHTGVSPYTLRVGKTYTLRVKAYPEDGNSDHITRSEVRFSRIRVRREIPGVGTPVLSIDNVARMEGGVNYLQPGIVTFHWHAEGEVDRYYVEICDESDRQVIADEFTDLQASVRTGAMNDGEIYTLNVYAIPKGGTLNDARAKSLRFCLPEVELPEPDPTPVPTPVPTPEPTLEPTEAPVAPTEVPEETPVPIPTADIPDDLIPEPTAVPTPESLPEVSEPVIALDNVVRTEEGVSYVAGDVVTISWSAEGDVESYYLELVDASNTVVGGNSTTDTSIGLNAALMNPNEVYTLYVTAIPTGGTKGTGALASIRFAALPEIAEPTEEPAVEPEPVPTEEPAVEPEPVPTEEPAVEPEPEPTQTPMVEPEPEPTEVPAVEPEPEPTEEPAVEPEPEPTESPVVEPEPTEAPIEEPVVEPEPAMEPEPTEEPMVEPEPEPTEEPTPEPTEEPTPEPTEEPTPGAHA